MNLKRKLWWAQHRTDVYKYGTILSLFLIVTISIIYFTYSKFSSTNEATAYETTVEPFIKNDYFIASYIDGVWSDTIPGKDDGYVVDKIVCDNGATATWDDDEWGINIRNATQKIKCGVYFKKIEKVTLKEKLESLAAVDTTNIATDDPANNIRYIGADPNNYVYFNCSDYSNQSDDTCEKWRIIGLFYYDWDSNGDGANVKIINMNKTLSLNASAFGGALGTGFSQSYVAEGLNNYLSTLSSETSNFLVKNMIWSLGTVNEDEITGIPKDYYAYERSNIRYSNDSYYQNDIGLIYPSDVGYATAGTYSLTGEIMEEYDRSYCLNLALPDHSGAKAGQDISYCDVNYLDGAGVTMTPFRVSDDKIDNYIYTLLVFNVGLHDIYRNEDYIYQSQPYKYKPVMYIKNNLKVTGGDGTSSNPYQLSVD